MPQSEDLISDLLRAETEFSQEQIFAERGLFDGIDQSHERIAYQLSAYRTHLRKPAVRKTSLNA
jgi:hypothetical protein